MYLQTKFLNKGRKETQWRKNKDTDRYFKKLFQ